MVTFHNRNMADTEWEGESNRLSGFSKWEGEDEDDIKDNWDDDGDEDKSEDEKPAVTISAIQVKKKKNMKEIIAEKEAKMKADLALKKLQEEEEREALTPENLLAEKVKRQKLQEESDLEMAKDTFGVDETISSDAGLDLMNPKSKEEFDDYGKALSQKIVSFSSSVYFMNFLEDLFRNVCANMESDDIKKLGSALNILSSEKLKAQKALKGGKKKSKKGGVKLERAQDYTVEDYGGDEYDDFI